MFPAQRDAIESPQVSTHYKVSEMYPDLHAQDRIQNVLSRESYPWGDQQSKRYSLKSQTGASQHRARNVPLDLGFAQGRSHQPNCQQNQTNNIKDHLAWEQQQPTVGTPDKTDVIFSHDDFYGMDEQRVGTRGKYSAFTPEAQQEIIKQQETKLMD
jgi:hypothetical protein